MEQIFSLLDKIPAFIPQVLGILAVVTFLASYQQKKRQHIILLNVLSRVLYILQYCLLGAFSGAALDVLGAISSVIAQKKHTSFISKHKRTVWIAVNAATVAVGLLLYEDVFSLLPIAGVLLHTGAFWLDDEVWIRRVSLAGSPFWFVYNFRNRAYGSAVGDALTVVSILIAIVRYRNRPHPEKE